jgi:hypothetical protein
MELFEKKPENIRPMLKAYEILCLYAPFLSAVGPSLAYISFTFSWEVSQDANVIKPLAE